MKHALYFAYGSALDAASRRSAVGGGDGPALLRGFRLAARRPQALVRDRAGAVQGVLLALPVALLERLDDQEGCWVRSLRSVRMADGRRCKAWVFQNAMAFGREDREAGFQTVDLEAQ